MKFTKLRLRGGNVIDLPVADASVSDRYILKSADGLGPPEIDVFIGDTLFNGGVYQGRRPQAREIVLLVGLNPRYFAGESAGDLRTELYQLLTQGSVGGPGPGGFATAYDTGVLIQVMNGDSVFMQTVGIIKKMENNIFTTTPEVQITLSCLQWYFEAPNEIHLDTGFGFDLLAVQNEGTAESGIHLEQLADGAATYWQFTDDFSGKVLRVDYPFETLDTIIVDSNPGNRGVWVNRLGVITSILGYVNTGAIWPTIHGGTNAHTIQSDNNWEWGEVNYTPKFWGV